jgi:cytochrome c-type biogenesis protein CcsB
VESVATTAVWLAIGATGIASALYVTHLLGLRLVMRRLTTDAGEGPVVASIERDNNGWTASLGQLASMSAWLGLALLAVSLVARWQAVDHAPWSNMYEFTIAFATGILGFYLAFERVYATRTEQSANADVRTRSTRTLGAVALPVVGAMLVISVAFFPDDVRPLVPALQNTDLLAIHVASMILAYAALSVSFAAAVLYLVQGSEQNRFRRLPRAETLDEIAYKSVMVGFPLLAAGIALGAYWANSAWGRYWGWDPKETSALATWLIYGIYLHTRSLRGWSGTRSAVVLVAGFLGVMFTYFVVNLWVSGLHSYAGV